MLDFLSPQLFDALVIIAIVVGLLLAGRRFWRDMRSGPRWPEDSRKSDETNQGGEPKP